MSRRLHANLHYNGSSQIIYSTVNAIFYSSSVIFLRKEGKTSLLKCVTTIRDFSKCNVCRDNAFGNICYFKVKCEK